MRGVNQRNYVVRALSFALFTVNQTEQDAQLSQRTRAAGCAIILAKSGRLELRDNILRAL